MYINCRFNYLLFKCNAHFLSSKFYSPGIVNGAVSRVTSRAQLVQHMIESTEQIIQYLHWVFLTKNK